jgi:hypothetical protein
VTTPLSLIWLFTPTVSTRLAGGLEGIGGLGEIAGLGETEGLGDGIATVLSHRTVQLVT